MSCTIIWEFRVAAENRERFEQVYGGEGDWARLFRRSPEFLGTSLLRDPSVPGRYLTLDSWHATEAFESFKSQHADDYKSLDAQCEMLTEYEMKVGIFETV